MLSLKSNAKELVFLDEVLKYLKNHSNENKTFKDLINDLKITEVKIQLKDKTSITFDYIYEKSWETNYYLASCLTYLINNGFVISPSKEEFRITFKGIIKLETNSFREDGFQSKWGKPKDFYLFILAIFSFIFALASKFC